LRELREIIYPSLKPERAVSKTAPEGFSHLATATVRYTLDLVTAEQIADLLAMTPHLYRAGAAGLAKAAALKALAVTVDVRLLRFSRR
jgi:23S rRNA (guanine745-N1)-methyltransferase